MIPKKYGNEELYIMVTLALHYPEGGHNGNTFWKIMTELYGDSLLKERIAGALREKWRKIAKEYTNRLEEYRNTLAEPLAKEFIENVEKVISDKHAEPIPLLAGNKRRAALLSKNNGDGIIEKEGIEPTAKRTRKKKIFSNIIIGKDSPMGEDIRTCIDLSQVTAKKSTGICKILKKHGLSALDVATENYLATKDQNPFVQELLKSTKIVEQSKVNLPRLEVVLGNTAKPINNIEWTELEDLALRHKENAELQNCLIRSKGELAVTSRKKVLGL